MSTTSNVLRISKVSGTLKHSKELEKKALIVGTFKVSVKHCIFMHILNIWWALFILENTKETVS
jgi:hypothetical protein